VAGEVNVRVPPLSLPSGEETAEEDAKKHEAVQLFVERARNFESSFTLTKPNTPVIARICRQLDGMPLAIELAAARIQILSLSQIESRLGDRLHLLTGGQTTLPRQQTLRATLAWSHDMLSDPEKTLFRRLSVFAGGWTLDAATSVCAEPGHDALDPLAQLVNRSLVVVERQPDAEVRYTMLETIREFAREQLQASHEMGSMRARHFDYFLGIAQQAEERLFAAESSVDWAETEIDNLRAALTWALEKAADGNPSKERAGRALELMLHIWPLWLSRGYSIEGNDWLNRLLAVPTPATWARARALLLTGDLEGFKGDMEKKALLIQQALELAQQIGDRKVIGMALMEMGMVKRDRRDPEAVRWFSEGLALFRELNESLWECRTCFLLAETYTMYGNLEAAKPLLARGLELGRAADDKWQIAWGLEGLGNVQRLEGDFEQAWQSHAESLALKVRVMDKLGIAYCLAAFAKLATAESQLRRAAILWGAAQQLAQTMNMILTPTGEGPDPAAFRELQARLGPQAWDAAWNQGWSMNLQEAVEYALTG
jgi:non-specific serine/threonine protein kinase